jgi:hypothetical protein
VGRAKLWQVKTHQYYTSSKMMGNKGAMRQLVYFCFAFLKIIKKKPKQIA